MKVKIKILIYLVGAAFLWFLSTGPEDGKYPALAAAFMLAIIGAAELVNSD